MCVSTHFPGGRQRKVRSGVEAQDLEILGLEWDIRRESGGFPTYV